MVTVRRLYVFLVCAISLQVVAWAVIALLRTLLTLGTSAPITGIAFQIAVIVVGLPIYLGHWLWAERSASRDPDERASVLRRIYLYGMMAALLVPFAAFGLDLVATLVALLLGVDERAPFSTGTPAQALTEDLVAVVVLGMLWLYHRRIVLPDARLRPETGIAALVRRFYVLVFSGVGAALTFITVISLLRWLMLHVGIADITLPARYVLPREVGRLAVGLPMWLIAWQWAQRLFRGPSDEERVSALRKFYLYLAVFLGVLSTVTSASFILAGIFRRLLGLPPEGDIRMPIAVIIGMGVLWAYHAAVLRDDAARAAEAPQQASIRRLYLYLVAGIALAAFLVGLGGLINTLIRVLSAAALNTVDREDIAFFSATLLAGLGVWVRPWWKAQLEAVRADRRGVEERRSVGRKIYLYFYLLAATLTVLASAVYLVSRLLGVLLGEPDPGNLATDLAQSIAFGLIGVGVWLYHGLALRTDGRLTHAQRAEALGQTRVAVLDVDPGEFGRALLDRLRRELPGLVLDPIGLTPSAAQAMGGGVGDSGVSERLLEAELIVGPWQIVVPGAAGGAVTPETAEAIAASAARKVLAPVPSGRWTWAGVERRSTEALAGETVRAVKQVLAGEEAHAANPFGTGAIVAAVVGGLALLCVLAIVLPAFLFPF